MEKHGEMIEVLMLYWWNTIYSTSLTLVYIKVIFKNYENQLKLKLVGRGKPRVYLCGTAVSVGQVYKMMASLFHLISSHCAGSILDSLTMLGV